MHDDGIDTQYIFVGTSLLGQSFFSAHTSELDTSLMEDEREREREMKKE